MARRWTINGRFLSQPTTGVQRYALEVVRAIDALIAEDAPLTRKLELRLLCPPGSADVPLSTIERREIGSAKGHLWEQTQLPASLDGGGLLSLCNTGPLLTRKHIVCMHDTNVWNTPQSYSTAFQALYRTLLPALGRTAWQVSTVSRFSLGQLEHRRIVREGRVFLAPNGHEHALCWRPAHSPATRQAASPQTIVMIGSAAPHKNIALILDMADRLADQGLRVAVVGMSDPHVFRTGSAKVKAANIHWLGRLSDGEMAALLQESLCLAFPSLTEGFGLPVLEAMALGCPVVVSDRASLPEICGDAALYAPCDDPQAWLDSFARLRDGRTVAQMAARGRARALAYSWRATARRYLAAMAVADGVPTEAENVPADAVT
jgi:glycosyltransferase involved in cell wall biosynthesis